MTAYREYQNELEAQTAPLAAVIFLYKKGNPSKRLKDCVQRLFHIKTKKSIVSSSDH